jgi:hypothetical protein
MPSPWIPSTTSRTDSRSSPARRPRALRAAPTAAPAENPVDKMRGPIVSPSFASAPSAARAAQAAVRQCRGQLKGLLLTVDGLVYASVRAAGAGAETKDLGFGLRFLLASRQPVLAVADRADSMAPIGVQLVKYVLHLLSGTGRPARGTGCPQRSRRGPGAGRPPRLWPPGCCPERNRGHRCRKDNGQRDVRRHQVLHRCTSSVMDCGRRSPALPSGPACPAHTALWTAAAGGVRPADELPPARQACGGRAVPQGQAFPPGPEIAPTEPG